MRRVRLSTSRHRLNADRPLSAFGKAGYFLLNWLNNQFPYAWLDPAAAVRDFVRTDVAARWPDLPRGASPSRTLSDLFWLTLPWTAIREELGEIRVFDAGCGSGQYGPRLLAWAGGQIESYTGTDAREHEAWASLAAGDPRLRFFRSQAEQFRGRIPAGTNLFISQSAVEHFDEDVVFFDQIRDYVRATTGPVLQIHLVPSQACLRLYHLHGVRQYTPRTLSTLTRLFAPDAYAVLYRLGGRAANRVHYSFITKPLLILGKGDRRKKEPEEYDRQLLAAVSDDMRLPQRSPAFWALVIHSRWNTRVFA
jgi:SAM-dependent methyltransferase